MLRDLCFIYFLCIYIYIIYNILIIYIVMKIVGIATRARITDYLLPYFFCTDSLVDTMAFFLAQLLHMLSLLCHIYYVYTYRHSANNEIEIINFLYLLFPFVNRYFAQILHLKSLNM